LQLLFFAGNNKTKIFVPGPARVTLEPAQVIVSIVDLAVDGGGGFLKGWRSAKRV